MNPYQHPLGFIGLGAMGGPMAQNLLRDGHSLTVFDLDTARMQTCVDAGAVPGQNVPDVVHQSDIVFTSLTNSDVFVQIAENDLLPNAREGQIFIDLGTVMPDDVRRLAAAFAVRGAHLLDVPVSGGVAGAMAGKLRMFAGGDERIFERVRSFLGCLGDPDYIVYCGPSSSGQIVKFVNQIAMGLTSAAQLESLALGVAAGIEPDLLARALGGDSGWRAQLRQIASQIARDEGVEVGVKFGQIPYFQAIARQLSLPLPLSDALYHFCESGERLTMEANRLSPSFWHELMKGGDAEKGK